MKKILLLVVIVNLTLIGCGKNDRTIDVTESAAESETVALLTDEQITYYEEFGSKIDEFISKIAVESDSTFKIKNIYLEKRLKDEGTEYSILINGTISNSSGTGTELVCYGYNYNEAASFFESNSDGLNNKLKWADEIINGTYSSSSEGDVFETYAPDIIHRTRPGEYGCDVYYGRMADSEMDKIQEKYNSKF